MIVVECLERRPPQVQAAAGCLRPAARQRRRRPRPRSERALPVALVLDRVVESPPLLPRPDAQRLQLLISEGASWDALQRVRSC